MALLKAEHITKIYGQRTIIKDINIELNQGELGMSSKYDKKKMF